MRPPDTLLRSAAIAFLLLALVSSTTPSHAEPGDVMVLGPYRAISLFGPARLDDEISYVSFSGDFGMKKTVTSWDPVAEHIDRHLSTEAPLLRRFDLNVINIEELLHGDLGDPIDLRQDAAALRLLVEGGFDLAAVANNHAWDYGDAGLDRTIQSLARENISSVGTRELPVFLWETEDQKIAIYSATHYTDVANESGRVLTLSDQDLATISHAIGEVDYRIAFIHLGSISSYPSPHELERVDRVIEAGANLVVCTGNHLVKGFAYRDGIPVHFGIGNHMMSWKGPNTETIGSHFVAGFQNGELVQMLSIPFYADISGGILGPLREADFAEFEAVFRRRSEFDERDYFNDEISRKLLFNELKFFTPARLLRYRPRHFVYGLGVVRAHYPVAFWTTIVIAILVSALAARWAWIRFVRRDAVDSDA